MPLLRSSPSSAPATRRVPRPHTSLLPWLIAALGVLAATLLYPLGEPRPGAMHSPAPPAAIGPEPAAPPPGAEPLQRQPVPAPVPVAAPALQFEQYVDQLVQLGLETTRLVAAGDETAARASDARSQALFADLQHHIADADEQALAAVGSGAPPAKTAPLPQQLRFMVYSLCIGTGLQRRHAEFEGTGKRQRLDYFANALLALLPQSPELAAGLGRAHLVDRPFLGAAHEAAVLAMAGFAGQGEFDQELATALLLTVWHNMLAEGVRSAEDIASRALVLLQETNPSLRAAASKLLLTDDRYREIVLQLVRDHQDAAMARQLALAAAGELPPETAIAVLRRLQATAGDLLPAFLLLGTRADGTLVRAYEQTLADDVDPQFRAELVSGAGFSSTPQGVQVAQLAFDHDPHPDVRTRALFVLTANAADAVGETTLNTAIDDATAREDSRELGAIVLALENLERAGLRNAVDRLGQRLRVCAALRDGDRSNLERILARALPGGQTTR